MDDIKLCLAAIILLMFSCRQPETAQSSIEVLPLEEKIAPCQETKIKNANCYQRVK
jgi:hypothetical protein